VLPWEPMRRPLSTLAALAVLATTASCLSPTLPLPPPDQPDTISVGSNNIWQISGTCIAGSLVTVFDTVSHSGIVVQDVNQIGSYHVALPGQACDFVWVMQETSDGDVSGQTGFVLETTLNGEPVGTPCP
jgi:hypothetical protein